MGHSSLTSFIPAPVKLAWFCERCKTLNGVIYKFTSNTETVVVSKFTPAPPTLLPYSMAIDSEDLPSTRGLDDVPEVPSMSTVEED